MNFIASGHFVTVALIEIGMRLISYNPGRVVRTNLRNLTGVRWFKLRPSRDGSLRDCFHCVGFSGTCQQAKMLSGATEFKNSLFKNQHFSKEMYD